MARPLRIEFENAFYHITTRGIERRIIFQDRNDRNRFMFYLKENLQRYKAIMYAYILMNNHYHLFVETLAPNLSRFMHDLNTAYTVYYNKRRSRVGPLFQGRYKAIVVDSESYLLELTRYIHLNPVRARIVSKAEDYLWCSYRTYIGKDRDEWVNLDWVKERFGNRWRKRYKQFVEDGLRGVNPLSDVKAGCILGSEPFVEKIKARISTKKWEKEVPSLRELKGLTIDEIVLKTSKYFSVGKEEVLKRRRNFLPRKVALYLARKCSPENIENIGKKFDISYPGVSKAIRRIEDEMATKKELARAIQHIKETL
jgi:putative transposase